MLQFAYNSVHYKRMGTGKVVVLGRKQMKVKGQGNWEFVSDDNTCENEVESENMADDENYEYGKLRAILHFQKHEPLDIGFC